MTSIPVVTIFTGAPASEELEATVVEDVTVVSDGADVGTDVLLQEATKDKMTVRAAKHKLIFPDLLIDIFPVPDNSITSLLYNT